MILLLLAIGMLYAAWCCVALSMDAHWRAVVGESVVPPVRRLRWLALVLLLLALVLCVLRDGRVFGALLWVCLVSICAWLVVLTLSGLKR